MAGDDSSAVRLSDRNLADIPEEVVLRCYDIRLLDLSQNPGIHLNSFLRRFKNVRRLELQQCALRGVPNDICELTQLEELFLSSNRFYQGLNPKIGQLHRLIKLDLVACGLKTLPESLGDLELLEELYLSRNDFFEGLPSVIGRLYGLKELALEGCGINNVPDSFGDLQLLINLNLSFNKLEIFPPCIRNMKRLETLDVSTNSKSNEAVRLGIKELPFELAETSMRVLKLDGNPITEPPEYIWRQGLHAIKSYFRETSYGTDDVCPDTINMVGNVAAGKTSIANYLEKGTPHPTEPEDRTRAMQQLKASLGENGERLVNINDFAGHKIYRSILPIFLPTDGLVILTFDTSGKKKEQEEALTHWLLTVIAKSKQIRLVVVGTHIDKVPPEELNAAEVDARNSVTAVMKVVVMEVQLHIYHLETQATTLRDRKLDELRDLLMRLQKAEVSYFFVNCIEHAPNQGLRSLSEKISSQLRLQSMPRRWFKVMKDITNAAPGRPYIYLKEAQEIYSRRITDVLGYSDLEVILRYLVSTSQIIWLERHEILRSFIFYSPQIVIDVCKKVLDHDGARHSQNGWEKMFPKHIKRYQEGRVEQPFMKVLLEPCDNDFFKIVVEFLKHFNLISEVINGSLIEYVIPSNLSKEVPGQLDSIKLCLKERNKSVVIRLHFFGSLVPVSFFETSISSILTVAFGLQLPGLQTMPWCDGVIIFYSGVDFASWREGNIVHLAAYSKNPDGLWSLMGPVLKRLHENVTNYWHGAAPECCLVCPECRFNCQNGALCGEVEGMTLETLASNFSPPHEERCTTCRATIPQYLCFPALKGISGQGATQAMDTLSGNCQWEAMDQGQLQKMFRSKYDYLITTLTVMEVGEIINVLFSHEMLIQSELEEVRLSKTPTNTATTLIDYIIKKNDKKMYCTVLEVLQNTLGRNQLVHDLLSARK